MVNSVCYNITFKRYDYSEYKKFWLHCKLNKNEWQCMYYASSHCANPNDKMSSFFKEMNPQDWAETKVW